MTTFRELMGNKKSATELSQQSPLELWFESVLDVPIDSLAIGDLCKAVRQEVFIEHLIPNVLNVLTEDPLAGEYYDGELITALSTIDSKKLKDPKEIFNKIKGVINKVDHLYIDNELKGSIEKINRMFI
ncbi:contact-dependent growth inhibition system immunity protein [Rouxiella sp. Mn2063]|uniref:contact-dependent growth inhibition system immunity protein n=1 Tax=Rouxiella sp. Mn2063 TaxID=3395262 RepID=UPI003BD68069